MMTRFRVKNYKCLKDVDIPLTPIHVLIGQNDTGKSSLLEAIYALARITERGAPVIDGFPMNWSGRELVNQECQEPAVLIGSEDYRVSLRFDEQQRGVKLQGEWFQDEKLPDSGGAVTLVSHGNAGIAQVNGWLSQIAKSHAGGRLFRLSPKLMALPSAIDQSKKFALDSDGFGLASLLDDIKDYSIRSYTELQQTFLEFFPSYTDIRLTKTNAFRRQKTNYASVDEFQPAAGKEIQLVSARGPICLKHASDGAILMLGFLALCHVPTALSVILIEEPENGIYPKRLPEIAQLLKRFVDQESNAPQIVLSTHSPYFMSEFEPEEITFMCRQPDGSVRARPLRESPAVREYYKKDFDYLGELWYNLSEEELFGDVPAAQSH